MLISCAFVPGPDTPAHIALAEALGYYRAWCYDSPAIAADVWMTLALAAGRTTRIGLAPGVLIPSLRHVMTTATAIATLEGQAPGRVAIGIGSGFTGRMTLGKRPLAWARVRAYVEALHGLLRGDEVAWEGAAIRMMPQPGFLPERPIRVPIIIGAEGPKGLAVARDLGDGIITAGNQGHGFSVAARLTYGTVLDPGEDPGSARALAAAGHAGALVYHARYERGGVEALPNGPAWKEKVEAVPERVRHLALHDGHMVAPGRIDRDTGIVTGELLARLKFAVPAEEWRARIAAWDGAGITEICYQPAGPDIPRELRAFAAMAAELKGAPA